MGPSSGPAIMSSLASDVHYDNCFNSMASQRKILSLSFPYIFLSTGSSWIQLIEYKSIANHVSWLCIDLLILKNMNSDSYDNYCTKPWNQLAVWVLDAMVNIRKISCSECQVYPQRAASHLTSWTRRCAALTWGLWRGNVSSLSMRRRSCRWVAAYTLLKGSFSQGFHMYL